MSQLSRRNPTQASGISLTYWPRLPSRWSAACGEPSSASTPPPAGWSSASARSGTCCSHFSLASDKDPTPFPVLTPNTPHWSDSWHPRYAKALYDCKGMQAEGYLKLGLAVRSVFVPLEGRAHQVVEARIPEIGHDVMAPSKSVQLVLLHGGQNLGDGGSTMIECSPMQIGARIHI